MVIKISEKPVISIDTGKALGTLKGFIYKNNKVTFLYCKFSDKYVYIPIKDAYIGSDAIMLNVIEDIHMVNTNTATKAYTENGKEVGILTSIEMDDFFNITGIIVDDLFIEIDKILHMENIIIVQIDKKDIGVSDPTSISSTVYTNVNDESIDQDRDTKSTNHKLIIEEGLAFIKQSSTPSTENAQAVEEVCESEINPQDKEEEFAIEIDERYSYLYGKKLLEDITIVKETYLKGTLIDASLIQFAINNNAIVKLIMNTED